MKVLLLGALRWRMQCIRQVRKWHFEKRLRKNSMVIPFPWKFSSFGRFLDGWKNQTPILLKSFLVKD
jgi:hypothetical protein